jgi:SynChlorMet cassette radical SAM/SPASM protein ScmE
MKTIPENPKRVMYSPKKVDLTITGKCNLRCIYCFHFDSAADVPDDLPKEEWLTFFEELTAASVLSVSVSGGEALFRKDFKEIIEGIVRNRMRFNLLSNGTLITDDIAEFLASTNRCDSVQVSIDGPDSSVHDPVCGKGSFDKAIRGLQALKKFGINRTVRLTITKYNYMYLEEAAKVLLEDIGLRSFSTNSACPFGLTKRDMDKIMLNPDEYAKSMELHNRIIKKYGKRVSAQAGPLSCYTHWSENEQKVINKEQPKPGGGYLTSCGGVFSKLSVRSDGIITPCTQMPHIELGRINQDSFLDIWHNHPELKRLRERRQIPLSNFEYCQDCEYMPYCRGGCPANAYELHGDENHPVYAIDTCYKKFKEEGGSLPLSEVNIA